MSDGEGAGDAAEGATARPSDGAAVSGSSDASRDASEGRASDASTRRDRIAVYGGTFDPFHNGHLAVARYLRDECGYGLVLVVPAGKPWLRARSPAAPALARLRMCQLATADESGIEVSDVDIRRLGETYTIDTVCQLRASYGDAAPLDVVIGADALASLDRWHRVDELLAQCEFVVIGRPGVDADEAVVSTDNMRFVDGPGIDVDATTIRRAYADGDYPTASTLVPPAVHRYIVSEELYWCVPTM